VLEKLLREFRKLKGTHTISVTLEVDDEGFLDRQCPAEHCLSEFKVLMDDRRKKGPNNRAWCPFCGSQDSSQEFNTAAQQDHIKQTALAHVERAIHRGLMESAQDFNRRQPRNAFLSMKMNVRSNSPRQPLPPSAAELMRTELGCTSCSCRYRVVGSAFFCPACGVCSVEQTFDQTVSRVRKSVALFAELSPKLDRDGAALLRTQLLEGGLSDLVTAFQYLAEALFVCLPGSATVRLRRNQFQSLTEGSTAWVNAGGRAFTLSMTPSEMADLERLFQQRHVLEHRDGFVDQSYLDRSGDTTYAVGERLVVRETGIERLADLVSKLSRALHEDLASAAPVA
jgi:hypothetical protein